MDRIKIVDSINEILKIKDSYKAPDRIMEIMYNKEERERIFLKMLDCFERDVSYDWFHVYFENEHADRKVKKQDYTPDSIATLLAKLTCNNANNLIYEPTVGTGGILIRKWWDILLKDGPFSYDPKKYLFVCEDLSDRSIPFLLLNLCIRGMNAVVIHGNVLTREAYGVFFVQNTNNDYLQFSDFNVMPYSEDVEKELNIKFVEKRYKPHIESEWGDVCD